MGGRATHDWLLLLKAGTRHSLLNEMADRVWLAVPAQKETGDPEGSLTQSARHAGAKKVHVSEK
ncbi:MAG: hypothetical protein HW380_2395 [Magnetococcales bacterium]|nr:hypothetical protein [Magnetococcales bacterium]